MNARWLAIVCAFSACAGQFAPAVVASEEPPAELAPLFHPPAEYAAGAARFGKYSSLLEFKDGRSVRTKADWLERRAEILADWQKEIGTWPALIEKPSLEHLGSTNRESFVQHAVRVQIAPNAYANGYLLVPRDNAATATTTIRQPRMPAVVVPYYEPESSIGTGKVQLRDFAYQLAKRGFVTLSIGSPGGDARKPDTAGVKVQPLHYLGYIAANCRKALANLEYVDAQRIGIVGHSYGGKWAMFAAAFDEGFACGVWSDPGIVFDESRPNVNYSEPWYLGMDPGTERERGVPSSENPRTGPYKRLFENGRDLHEVMALMASRPFLVSGGSEDPTERWQALNRVNEVYTLLGAPNRVAMSSRPDHNPTVESNEQIYHFFEYFLQPSR